MPLGGHPGFAGVTVCFAAAYYVERFPEDFRMPDEDGLVE